MINHVLLDTSPTAAAPRAPRLPTIAASTYSITMVARYDSMAGTLSRIVSRSSSRRLRASPPRSFSSRSVRSISSTPSQGPITF
ncbi:hypothetical protein [Fretibacterium fastidiosum]|uniref:hypothetical protein n=1 Tax=Fretibacterium fastidiosum TaxID=651822 RepID=UPI0038FC6A3A